VRDLRSDLLRAALFLVARVVEEDSESGGKRTREFRKARMRALVLPVQGGEGVACPGRLFAVSEDASVKFKLRPSWP
jgi:hypothetical protein